MPVVAHFHKPEHVLHQLKEEESLVLPSPVSERKQLGLGASPEHVSVNARDKDEVKESAGLVLIG